MTGSNWNSACRPVFIFGWDSPSTLPDMISKLGGRHVFAMIGRSFLNRVGEPD